MGDWGCAGFGILGQREQSGEHRDRIHGSLAVTIPNENDTSTVQRNSAGASAPRESHLVARCEHSSESFPFLRGRDSSLRPRSIATQIDCDCRSEVKVISDAGFSFNRAATWELERKLGKKGSGNAWVN